ncbi:MAG: nucleoside deaminase [Desulfococcus multivorans]|jgi:tRNA(adenine34) deaminase|uniref:nucleoside deaminase n=1 Tax=Desulfococcus sp. TaxID=2025834 RepID=UPI002A493F7E|nr:nucleoside deaminase [Desulfococcus multivorans]
MNHRYFMEKALAQARSALDRGEFPVGCVIVHENEIIAVGAREGTAGGGVNETDHAEMVALRRLDALGIQAPRERLTLYCTMEPCLMCFGAILIAGIGAVVWAYEDAMGGGTGCDRSTLPPLYRDRRITIVSGVLRRESLALFQAFFRDPANAYWSGSFLARYTLAQAAGG